MAGRLMFPAFPNRRVLPWALTGLGVLGIGAGLIMDDGTLMTIGALGLGGAVAGYALSRLVLGAAPVEEEARSDD